jgi:hypothetical protein
MTKLTPGQKANRRNGRTSRKAAKITRQLARKAGTIDETIESVNQRIRNTEGEPRNAPGPTVEDSIEETIQSVNERIRNT